MPCIELEIAAMEDKSSTALANQKIIAVSRTVTTTALHLGEVNIQMAMRTRSSLPMHIFIPRRSQNGRATVLIQLPPVQVRTQVFESRLD
jgi:hypothetical protein